MAQPISIRTNMSPPQKAWPCVVRVVAVVTGNRNDELGLTFEVILGKDGAIAKNKGVFFGFQGTLSGQLHPFILRTDGRIDFGSEWEDPEQRYVTTNFLDKKLEVGATFTTNEYFTPKNRAREFVYAVKQIVPIT